MENKYFFKFFIDLGILINNNLNFIKLFKLKYANQPVLPSTTTFAFSGRWTADVGQRAKWRPPFGDYCDEGMSGKNHRHFDDLNRWMMPTMMKRWQMASKIGEN
jgi:hypothetical protein